MKKLLLSLASVIFLSLSVSAQSAKSFLSGGENVTWLGIDYSQVKLIGDFNQFGGAGEANASDIRDKYFNDWNNIVEREPKKYDVAKYFKQSNVTYKTDFFNARNSKADVKNMEASTDPNYTIDDIKKFVKSYNFDKVSGVAILMVAESLNRSSEKGTFHIVVVNTSNKEILIHERALGKPGGFGLRNYWAASYFNIFKDVEKSYIKKWKSQHK